MRCKDCKFWERSITSFIDDDFVTQEQKGSIGECSELETIAYWEDAKAAEEECEKQTVMGSNLFTHENFGCIKFNQKKMKTVRNIFYIVLPLLLLSCKERLTEGVIIDKFYEESRYYTVPEYDVVLKMVVSRTKYDDEDFVFLVENVVNGDTIIQRFEVNPITYDSYELWDWIEFKP